MNDKQLNIIVVDLTPILPGGENGGAKIFVLELLRRLAAMSPKTHFILLTQSASHDELADMDCTNISRRMVIGPVIANSIRPRLQGIVKRFLSHLPLRLRQIAMSAIYRLQVYLKRGGSSTLLHELGADLLFCPFTAPTYFEPGIPTVCTIYDLQYKTYPEFFTPEDVAHRDQTFIEASRRADVLAAISDYSRETAINHGNLSRERIRTIHLRMAQRISFQTEDAGHEVIKRLELIKGRFLVYPANFWKHKNHEMLLTAFGIACQSSLASDVKLVCTGAPGERHKYLSQAATALGVGGRVILPGYLPVKELAAVLSNARGMIFPSLYEGFGLPVIEAMAAGIPVACSNTTSLPEVAANAAILFDPRIPTQIADAIIELAENVSRRQQLIASGRQRATEFADSDRMAREYWDLFCNALTIVRHENHITGIHEDGWLGSDLTVHLAPFKAGQRLELLLSAPDWLPVSKVQVTANINGKSLGRVFGLLPGQEDTLSVPLAWDGAKRVALQIAPTFIPVQNGISEDSRLLSLIIKEVTIIGADGDKQKLYPESIVEPL